MDSLGMGGLIVCADCGQPTAAILARSKTKPATISFIAWCFSLQFFIIGILGVGLIHKYLNWPYLLGDCHLDGYPRWIKYIQIALVFNVYPRWVAAAMQAAIDVFIAIFRRDQSSRRYFSIDSKFYPGNNTIAGPQPPKPKKYPSETKDGHPLTA